MIVTLIGYRGSGKSTVGSALAARLGWDMIDADRIIEERAGMSIAEIFVQQGEPHFRRLEREVLAELLQRDRLVIAPGGGAVLDEGTRKLMRQAGPVVWLKGSVETLRQRIQSDPSTTGTRPPLTSAGDVADEIRQVLAVREPVYAAAAHFLVETDGRAVAEIVDEIARQLPPQRGEEA